MIYNLICSSGHPHNVLWTLVESLKSDTSLSIVLRVEHALNIWKSYYLEREIIS